MQLVGINTQCRNDAMALALRKVNYKLLAKPVRWPSLRNRPKVMRVEANGVMFNLTERRTPQIS